MRWRSCGTCSRPKTWSRKPSSPPGSEELVRRLSDEPGGVSLFTFIPPGPSLSFQEVWAKEGYTGGTVGSVQTFYFVGEEAWTVDRLSALPAVDVVIRLSRE